MSELVLANARVVIRDQTFPGAVRVEGGRIAEVYVTPATLRGSVDCEGDWLIPGLVELHTDVLERHAFPRPGVQWPADAAVVAYDAQLAAAGITTSFDSLAIGYVIDSGHRPRDPRPLADAIRRTQARGLLRAEHFLHIRCEVGTAEVVTDFEPFADDPLVCLVSLMDHTPGQRQFVSLEKYREFYQGKYALSDAQLTALMEARVSDQGRYAARHRAEITRRCQSRGLTLVSHDDATIAHVEEAAKIGVTIAEFPTTLEAAHAARAYGLAILAGAPNVVCGRSHSGNVSALELAGSGLLDILSSDYVPGSLLHAAVVLHTRLGLPVAAAIATVSAAPAERAGLDDRGEIAPGKRADLVRVRVVDGLPVIRGVWRAGRRIA
ncbi:MAG TPA: alpha-D-ribose 1-methylphosphonate 5-triphosphate diphosphatase [Methylomirabilota bacterium]|nr:alpha-D-ribose 1-methylphosphonate 5-triphosphate diphosphatase [Methylomirabilota bacterium]